MSEALPWALDHARRQTLALVHDVREDERCSQAAPGEHHPAWILGHLLLGDVYLLHLINVEALPEDFAFLVSVYGPTAAPTQSIQAYPLNSVLVERLTRTGAARVHAVQLMGLRDLERQNPDAFLAQSQPTVRHHLHALVFHEGYHGGQLSAWRKSHRLAPVRWVLAPGAPGPT